MLGCISLPCFLALAYDLWLCAFDLPECFLLANFDQLDLWLSAFDLHLTVLTIPTLIYKPFDLHDYLPINLSGYLPLTCLTSNTFDLPDLQPSTRGFYQSFSRVICDVYMSKYIGLKRPNIFILVFVHGQISKIPLVLQNVYWSE